MVAEDRARDGFDVAVGGGRTVRVHDSGASSADGLTLVWHHGSPQTGALLRPVLDAATSRGIRLLSYGRPSYGGSTPQPGRRIADAAPDVAAIADALGIERFATMGASGGGPHALACAAILPTRIQSVATLAGIAPLTAEFDWFAGMADPGGPRAARGGRDARAAYAEIDEFDPSSFVPADYEALENAWASLGDDVQASAAWGNDGLIDDDVAIVEPWGFDVRSITAPTLIVQGTDDRVVPAAHGEFLYGKIAGSELWLRPGEGHVSILREVATAMDWMLTRER